MRALAICWLLVIASSFTAIAQEVVPARAEAADDSLQQVERIRQVVRSLGPRASTPAQLVQLARELPAQEAARLFLEIGQEYLAAGHWDVGAAVLLELLRQYPDDSASEAATLALVRLYSSSEVARAERQVRDASAELRLPAGWSQKQSSTNASPRDPSMLTYSLHLANGRLHSHPGLAENSALAFQCAAAARLSGDSQQQKSWLALVKHKRDGTAWRARAQAEQWLAESRRGEPPLPASQCLRAEAPPHLDGVLSEPCWQTVSESTTDAADQETDATARNAGIRLAYDDEHLYLAASYPKRAGGDYANDPRPRTYDADLSGHDQMRLWLDVDRDYATWFALAIDHRGWTGDRCWHDAGWNPKWYVAAAADDNSWTVEAAIPWSELADRSPRAGEAWAMAAERVADGAANGGDTPGEFGLLLFE